MYEVFMLYSSKWFCITTVAHTHVRDYCFQRCMKCSCCILASGFVLLQYIYTAHTHVHVRDFLLSNFQRCMKCSCCILARGFVLLQYIYTAHTRVRDFCLVTSNDNAIILQHSHNRVCLILANLSGHYVHSHCSCIYMYMCA